MSAREVRATLAAVLARADSPRTESATFTAAELGVWPASLRQALTQGRIVRRSRPQQAVPCPGCDEDHVVEVNWLGERALAWCPSAGRISIDASLLDSYTFRAGRLAEHLHELLGISEPLQAITPERLWRLGVVGNSAPATAFFLVRGVGWDDGHQVLQHPSIRRSLGAVLITLVDLPGAEADRLLPLSRVLNVAGDQLTLDMPAAVAALGERRPAVSAPTLRREGKGWHLAYEGERAALRDSVGLAYIRLLVTTPFHPLEPPELVSLVATTAGAPKSETMAEDGLGRGEHRAVPVLDAEGRRALSARIAELREAGHHDQATEIEHHLRQATRPGGTSKTFDSPSIQAARNVRRAVTRALDAIQAEAPRCSVHLRGAIVLGTGKPLEYRPELPHRWVTD